MDLLSPSYLQEIQQLQQTDKLELILTDGIVDLFRNNDLLPGVYAGFDPAEINDRSGFVMISKDLPTLEIPNPKVRVRCLRDLSIDSSGYKSVTYLNQVKQIVEFDKKYKIQNILIDGTSHQTVVELLQEHFGSRAEGLTFTKPKKAQMIQSLRLIFQEKLIEFDKTHKNFDIFRTEAYELDSVNLKHPKGGTDDLFWALALAVKATGICSGYNKIESGFSDDIPFYF